MTEQSDAQPYSVNDLFAMAKIKPHGERFEATAQYIRDLEAQIAALENQENAYREALADTAFYISRCTDLEARLARYEAGVTGAEAAEVAAPIMRAMDNNEPIEMQPLLQAFLNRRKERPA